MDIQLFQSANQFEVIDLFEKSFGKKFAVNSWKWRYENNPFFSEKLIDLMWDNNVLVGHYALWPIELIFDGNIYKSAMSMTTMTHPNYGGKGIFTSLAKSVYQKAFQNNKVEYIWGFPNKNSHYGFVNKLNWKDIATIPMLIADQSFLDKYPSQEFVLRNKFTDKDSKLLSEKTQNQICVNKTAKYLNWRYFQNPNFEYKVISSASDINNFIVFKLVKFDKSLGSLFDVDILEWNIENRIESFAELFSALKKYLKENDIQINKINTWISIFDQRHLILEKCGFLLTQPVAFFGGLQTPFRETNIVLNEYKNWSISMGDSDVF